jgi:hypothetical protein
MLFDSFLFGDGSFLSSILLSEGDCGKSLSLFGSLGLSSLFLLLDGLQPLVHLIDVSLFLGCDFLSLSIIKLFQLLLMEG